MIINSEDDMSTDDEEEEGGGEDTYMIKNSKDEMSINKLHPRWQQKTKNKNDDNLSFNRACFLILFESKKPCMNTKDIWNKIKEKKFIKVFGKTPHQTVSATISTDIKNFGKDSLFERSSPGMFRINKKF